MNPHNPHLIVLVMNPQHQMITLKLVLSMNLQRMITLLMMMMIKLMNLHMTLKHTNLGNAIRYLRLNRNPFRKKVLNVESVPCGFIFLVWVLDPERKNLDGTLHGFAQNANDLFFMMYIRKKLLFL